MKTVIVDYGAGNLFSLVSSIKYLGHDAVVVRTLADIKAADKLILPGVGAFAPAAKKLSEGGFFDAIRDKVSAGAPLLGICLGMQLLFEKSYEFGVADGLALIPGDIVSLQETLNGRQDLKLPHMGWNALDIKEDTVLTRDINSGEYVYYVHSFYAKTAPKYIAATSDYGVAVPGIVKNANVSGCQFHPEKSGETGLKILNAFFKD